MDAKSYYTQATAQLHERDFQSHVVTYARLKGWLCYHTHDSRRSEPGFPDLVLVKGTRVIFAELKSKTGKTTKEQEQWLRALSGVETVDACLWRPEDWDHILQTL